MPVGTPNLADVSSEVQQYAVWEQDSKDETGFVGYCYFDLFPRGLLFRSFFINVFFYIDLGLANKYSHAAVWSLLPGCQLPNGQYSYPLAAMVANLAKP